MWDDLLIHTLVIGDLMVRLMEQELNGATISRKNTTAIEVH